jgi:putative phosphoribosyl transferase
MSGIHVYQRVERSFPAFCDRSDAGTRLAGFVRPDPKEDAVVLAVPRGGVPVGEPLAEALNAPLHLVPVRKLPIPRNPEAGFGAVALDGSRVLNDELVYHFGLTQSQVDSVTQEVLDEVRRRAREYGSDEHPLPVENRTAYLVDDGLASGYTMIAAARMVRNLAPRALVLAVPCSPWNSIGGVQPHFDEMYFLYVQERTPFAVASYYRYFPDLTDDEVREILSRA